MLTVEVDILTEIALPHDADPDSLIPLIEWVLNEEQQSGRWSIAVVLTSDDALRALHNRYMAIDSETDVLTFPSEGPGGAGGGDIVISVERAAEQGPEWGLSIWEEIRFLVVHGTLHLCGWVDDLEEERAAMCERQCVLIAAFDRRDSEPNALGTTL